jgi:hypothetical protein
MPEPLAFAQTSPLCVAIQLCVAIKRGTVRPHVAQPLLAAAPRLIGALVRPLRVINGKGSSEAVTNLPTYACWFAVRVGRTSLPQG